MQKEKKKMKIDKEKKEKPVHIFSIFKGSPEFLHSQFLAPLIIICVLI